MSLHDLKCSMKTKASSVGSLRTHEGPPMYIHGTSEGIKDGIEAAWHSELSSIGCT